MKLFIPGPVEVRESLLKEMSKPMIGHRSVEFSDLYTNVVDKIKKIMQTSNKIFISTSSSTGLMESAIRNCTNGNILNITNGAFGERWHEITKKNGKNCEKLEFEWGTPVEPSILSKELDEKKYDAVTLVHNESSTALENPIEEISDVIPEDTLFLVDTVSSMGGVDIPVDENNIDVCLFGTQKCMGLPPGLSFCSVSNNAIKKSKNVGNKGYYFSFSTFEKYNKKNQTPTTPNISLMYALNKQLNYILHEEGLKKRWKRHKRMAEMVRDWANENFSVYPKEGHESNTLTAIGDVEEVDVKLLINKLKKEGYLISNGYGKLAGDTFRIGHMADRGPSDLKNLLNKINQILEI